MAKRGKAGDKVVDNDFDLDTAQAYFDRLDEINDRMKSDAAAGRGDMNSVYDEMVDDLGVTKEAAKFLWSHHATEQRFINKAKKLDTVDRKALERFAGAMDGTPFGDWAKEAAELSEDASGEGGQASMTTTKAKKRKAPKAKTPKKPKAPKGGVADAGTGADADE
jgi:hypothetical protein